MASYITDLHKYSYIPASTEGELCGITYTPLESTSVKLQCGHSFNYEPLMSNILMHNTSKYAKRPKKRCIIECPYCRNIHTETIPYYEENFGIIPYLYGVHSNSLEEVEKYTDKEFIKTHKAHQKELARIRVAEERKAEKMANKSPKKTKASVATMPDDK